MSNFSSLLQVVGVLAFVVGALWLLIAAFQESVGWGLACLFLAPLTLLFIILHWDRAARPLGLKLGGIVAIVAGFVLGDPSGM